MLCIGFIINALVVTGGERRQDDGAGQAAEEAEGHGLASAGVLPGKEMNAIELKVEKESLKKN